MTTNNMNANNARNTNKLDSVKALESAGYKPYDGDGVTARDLHPADVIVVTNEANWKQGPTIKRKGLVTSGMTIADGAVAYATVGKDEKALRADLVWHAARQRARKTVKTHAVSVYFSLDAQKTYDKANAKAEAKAA